MKQFFASLVVLVTMVSSANAHHLTLVDIEECANQCLGQVLSGQRDLNDCIAFAPATRRVVGPPARGLSDDELQPIASVIEEVLRARIQNSAGDFVGSTIQVTSIQESLRQRHVYGVEGWVRRPTGSDYEFSVNGIFNSRNRCQAYTLTIGPFSINQWLKEQTSVRRAIRDQGLN